MIGGLFILLLWLQIYIFCFYSEKISVFVFMSSDLLFLTKN